MSEELLFFLMRLGERIATEPRPDIEQVGVALYNIALCHQDSWRDFQEHRNKNMLPFADAEEHNPARTIELDCDNDTSLEPSNQYVQAAE